MRRSATTLASVVVSVFVVASVSMGTYTSATEAQEAVLGSPGQLAPDERASAHAMLKARWEKAPEDVQNLHALVRVCEQMDEWETGLPAARALAKLSPDVADHQYLLGNALFGTINEVSMFNKGARASAGRKAYERAVSLDPTHVGARSGLFYFYMEAPGFAGGSTKKANRIAQAMRDEPENASVGLELLMALAAKQEDWDGYRSLLPQAVEAASEEQRAPILLRSTYTMLFTAKDHEAGLELAGWYRRLTGEGRDGYTTNYFEGVALHGLGRHDEAVAKFEAVLEVVPTARNTRFLLAEALEALGRDAEASRQYHEFAERFSDDDRAKKAKKKAKKLARG